MLFEVATNLIFASIGGYVFYKEKHAGNDHKKIEMISNNIGLFKNEIKDKKTTKKTIRIMRKSKIENVMEYFYQIPLGMSFHDFESKKNYFQDGLNIKRPGWDINLKDLKLKELKWDKTIFTQIQEVLCKRTDLNKHVEMEFDGMLKIRVYDKGLEDTYFLTEDMFKGLKKWEIPLGVSLKGIIKVDFDATSHLLVGGATDMGKSNALNLIITVLVNNNPEDIRLTLIDLKGGLEFANYEQLKQVKNFATNVPESLIALQNVHNEMTCTFQAIRSKGFKGVKQAKIPTRHFVIIDEAAELSSIGETDPDIKKLKIDCENIIKDIARRGRASGMKLIYCTQYPTTETISSQVKRNLLARICLPVDTHTASKVVLDEGGAEDLPLIQGRAFYKRHRKTEMQIYYVDDEIIDKVIKPHVTIRARSEPLNEPEKLSVEGRQDRLNLTLIEKT